MHFYFLGVLLGILWASLSTKRVANVQMKSMCILTEMWFELLSQEYLSTFVSSLKYLFTRALLLKVGCLPTVSTSLGRHQENPPLGLSGCQYCPPWWEGRGSNWCLSGSESKVSADKEEEVKLLSTLDSGKKRYICSCQILSSKLYLYLCLHLYLYLCLYLCRIETCGA